MKLQTLGSLTVLVLLGTQALAQAICPNPARASPQCVSFNPYDLPFIPPPLSKGVATTDEARSDFFFAVILKTRARCGITEAERRTVQPLFPNRKVFLARFQCDAESPFNYSNFDSDRLTFMAVYGGRSLGEANSFLRQVRANPRFGDAYVRRMQVVLVYP